MRARSALYFSNIKVILREVVLRNKPKEMLDVSSKATVPVLVLKEKFSAFMASFTFESLVRDDGKLILLPVVMGLAIVWYFNMRSEPPAFLILASTIGGACVAGVLWPYRMRSSAYRYGFIALCTVLLVLLGLCVASLKTALVKSPVLSYELKVTEVTGIIVEKEILKRPQDYRLLIKPLSIEKLPQDKLPHYVRL